jgi:hypothetical protein
MTSEPTRLDAAEQSRLAPVIARYLADRYGWTEEAYRLDFRALSADGQTATVWAVFLEDERNPVPGGGRSRELLVDRAVGAVQRDLRFQ